MVPGLAAAAGWAFLLCVGGLAAATVGLLAQWRAMALAGLLAYAAGLGAALGPFVATMRRRRPRGAAAWMCAVGIAWLALAVVADLAALWTPAGWWTSTAASAGWSRPWWWALGCRC